MTQAPVTIIWRYLKTIYPDAFFYLEDRDDSTSAADQVMGRTENKDSQDKHGTQTAMI